MIRRRIAGIEQIADRVVDPPEHGEIDVDDVLVAGKHQALFQARSDRASAAGLDAGAAGGAVADLDAVDPRDGRRLDALDRPGQMIVEAGQRHAG